MPDQIINTVTSLSPDILATVAFFLLVATLALSVRTKKVLSAILAFYPAALVFEFYPYLSNSVVVGQDPLLIYLNKLAVFAAFVVLGYVVFSTFLKGKTLEAHGSRKMLAAGLIGLSATVLVVVLVLSIIPIMPLYEPSSIAMTIAQTRYTFWFLLTPLALLYLMPRE